MTEKSFLHQTKTEESIHVLENDIKKSIDKHVLLTKEKRDYQIEQIQNYIINYEPKICPILKQDKLEHF